MLEDYVGESGWRAGVRRYIARHRYGNTVTEDLWRAVESESGSPVTAIARDFTTQPGVPLIRVTGGECRNGRTAVSLTQNEFSRDRPHAEPLRWRVPVIAAAGAAETRTLVEGGSASLAVAGCGPLVVNHGQTGYYRTLYTKPLLARLTRDFARLRPVDQIGLIADNWALGLAGYQRASAALDMAEAAPAGGSGHLWSRIADLYGELYSRYSGDAARQAKIAAHASARLRPVLDRLGWTPRAGEAAFDPVLRAELIDALSKLGDPTTVAEARRRFVAGDISVTAGPLRSTLLGVIAENADSATWEQLRAQARAETNPLVKAQLYTLLGTPRDERLARAALALALTPEPGATTASEIIAAVADTHPDLALDFALRNRAAVDALVDSSSRSRFIARLGSGSSSPAAIESLEAYAREHLTPQSRGSVDRTIASIRDRIRSREHARADLNRWVDRRASQTAARRV